MSKNIKSVALGLATSLVAPITSFANTVADNTVSQSSNLSRAVNSLDKVGVVTGVANNDYLNVRSNADTKSTSIGKMGNGETLVITGKDGEWYQINYYGKTGYVYEKYAEIKGDILFRTTTENLNLRKTMNTSSEVLGVIPKNTTVKVLSSSNGWSRVYYNGKFGYCYSSYLVSNNNNTNNNTSSITTLNKEGKVINVASNDTLNVRSLPNTSGSVITTLTNGTKVQVIGQDTQTKWYKISYNGKTGYVSNSYISIVGAWNSSTTTTMYTTTNLNLRSGSSTSHSILTTIPSGASVTCYSKDSNGWMKVSYNGITGYVNASYLTSSKPSTSTATKVTTTNVNLRTGAGTQYSIIRTVASNTTVEVLGTSGSWYKVKVGSDTGYILGDYLKDYNSSNSSSNLVPSKSLYSKVKVVVDAGHGGTDPGAVGNGYKEKDIVLSISQKVNSKLKSLGFQTVMTRNTDTYITLSNRYSIANSNNADLFVSVHANSATGTASGIETLYKGSKTFANYIQNGMLNETGAKNRGLKYRSDLAVLNGTKMPSALVEVGFISDATEASKIGSNAYQEKLAVGIVNGIAKYTDSNISK